MAPDTRWSGEAHPLDPLTPEEIRLAADTISSAHPEIGEPRFPLLTLDEPPKDAALDWRPGEPRTDERSRSCSTGMRATNEAVVHLAPRPVVVWTPLTGVQPSILLEEVIALQEIVRGDPAARKPSPPAA